MGHRALLAHVPEGFPGMFAILAGVVVEMIRELGGVKSLRHQLPLLSAWLSDSATHLSTLKERDSQRDIDSVRRHDLQRCAKRVRNSVVPIAPFHPYLLNASRIYSVLFRFR
jgi:hypothetical protein